MLKTNEDEVEKPNQPTFGGMLGLAVAVSLGVFVYSLLSSATLSFISFGIFWGLINSIASAVISVPVFLIIYLVLRSLRRGRGLPIWLNNKNLLWLGLVCILVGVSTGLYGTIPKVRYERQFGIASEEISNLKVEGFDSFLARRWLFSFSIDQDGCDEIVSKLNLLECGMAKPIQEDMFFKDKDIPWLASLPRPEDSKIFINASDATRKSVNWITFVYDPETGNARLYKGYQN
ncbi:MAG: hypothetical protein ACSHX9_05910 [Luteolibacter sp.]